MPDLPVIMRPNGKPYRPRAVVAFSVTDEDEIICGVVVLGTHDRDRAKPLADELVRRELGRNYAAVNPGAVWWRDGFTSGRRSWITDEEHGRPGIWFAGIEEVPPDARAR